MLTQPKIDHDFQVDPVYNCPGLSGWEVTTVDAILSTSAIEYQLAIKNMGLIVYTIEAWEVLYFLKKKNELISLHLG